MRSHSPMRSFSTGTSEGLTLRPAGEAGGEACRGPIALEIGFSPVGCPGGVIVLVPAAAAAEAAEAIILASADDEARIPGGKITAPVAPLDVLAAELVPFACETFVEREEGVIGGLLKLLGP